MTYVICVNYSSDIETDYVQVSVKDGISAKDVVEIMAEKRTEMMQDADNQFTITAEDVLDELESDRKILSWNYIDFDDSVYF